LSSYFGLPFNRPWKVPRISNQNHSEDTLIYTNYASYGLSQSLSWSYDFELNFEFILWLALQPTLTSCKNIKPKSFWRYTHIYKLCFIWFEWSFELILWLWAKLWVHPLACPWSAKNIRLLSSKQNHSEDTLIYTNYASYGLSQSLSWSFDLLEWLWRKVSLQTEQLNFLIYWDSHHSKEMLNCKNVALRWRLECIFDLKFDPNFELTLAEWLCQLLITWIIRKIRSNEQMM